MDPVRAREPADRPVQSDAHDEDWDDDAESPLEDIVAGITIGVILTVAFGLLALGVPWFWIVFPIGFAGMLPAVIGLTKLYERRRERTVDRRRRGTERARGSEGETRDALETLRDRYARGELTDDEFEARLERLVATESREDATRLVRDRERRRTDREGAGGESKDAEFEGSTR